MPHLALNIQRTPTTSKLTCCHITTALVRRYLLALYVGTPFNSVEQTLNASSSKNRTIFIQKHRIIFSCHRTTAQFSKMRTMLREILMQRLKAFPGYRNLLPLIALAMNDKYPHITIDINQSQAHQLPQSDSSIDKNRHNCTVTCRQSFTYMRIMLIPDTTLITSLKQLPHIIRSKGGYKSLLNLWQFETRSYGLN